jgi:2',3'-cyclic-nucleotide 2'-phosphodiesterase (5'-nucleotidase family)
MADKKLLVTSNAIAASLVVRMIAKTDAKGAVVLDENKNPVPVEGKVTADDVMAFQEYDDKVVVVTVSGEKLVCEKDSDTWKKFADKASK